MPPFANKWGHSKWQGSWAFNLEAAINCNTLSWQHRVWGALLFVVPGITHLFIWIPNISETSLGVTGTLRLSTIKKKKKGRNEWACSFQLLGRWQSQRLETLGESTGTKGAKIVPVHCLQLPKELEGIYRTERQTASKSLQPSSSGCSYLLARRCSHPAKHCRSKGHRQLKHNAWQALRALY